MDKKWWLPDTKGFIALAIVGAFVSAVFIWMIFPPSNIDQAALTVINMLLGALVAKFGTVVDFNFGSSQGSKDKDDAQNKIVQNLTAASTPTEIKSDVTKVESTGTTNVWPAKS